MQAIERTALSLFRRGALIELLIELLRLVVGSRALSFPSPREEAPSTGAEGEEEG
jgi:hypothetical protein